MNTPRPGARGTDPSPEGDDSPPALSVILPVLNEARDIGRLLEDLRGQAPPPGGVEVLVVDGGSRDDTREIVGRLAREWPALRLLDNPGRRSGPARNVGAAHARGEYVLYIDGHCSLPRRDYLVRLLALFQESGADCLARPQPLVDLAEGAWSRAIARARHSRLGHNPGSDIYSSTPGFTDPRSAGAAYRRETLHRLGGYDERFDACEDVEFNHRVQAAGLRAYRHPDLAVHYRPRSSLGGLFRQMVRYGRGRAHLMARHPGVIPWPLVGLAVITLGIVLAPLLWRPAGLFVPPALLGGWLILLVAEGLRIGGPGLDGLRVAASLGATHAGLLAGFFRGLVEFGRFRPGPAPSPAWSRSGGVR